jgi:FdrA protein
MLRPATACFFANKDRIMLIQSAIRRNSYYDSITLMQVATRLKSLPGVVEAAALMATPGNLQLLAEIGLSPASPQEMPAGPADLLIVVSAQDEESARAALQVAGDLLRAQAAGSSSSGAFAPAAWPPRSLEEAVRRSPGARLAVISVPGPYAALESERALRTGLHVFLFSNNVPLAAEVALKRLARERGLLLMGPDCGTAMLDGVGLGFVNVVPRGPIGIVAASGTGCQQVMSLIAQQGSGVSQVIGCGGRDLSQEVGAITTLAGLRLLLADEETRVIVLISKPPAATVAGQVIEAAAAGNKPVVVCFLGDARTLPIAPHTGRLLSVPTLTEAATLAAQLAGGAAPADYAAASTPLRQTMERLASLGEKKALSSARGRLVGLFAGGTLCDEAMQLWSTFLGPIFSNTPLQAQWQLAPGEQATSHCAIDFGADEYTRGRPHPLIDPTLRLQRLQREAADPTVAVIMLDIILGYCAHPDPAAVYAPVIAEITAQPQHPAVVAVVCGTEGDPQRLSAQITRLQEAGARVFTSNAEAALHCVELLAEAEEERSHVH